MTLHNHLYELIISHYQRSNDSNIFLLLKLIDGNLLSRENQIDSIKNQESRFGIKVNFDNSFFNAINSLDNCNKIMIAVKSSCQNENIETASKFIINEIINDGLKYILNQENYSAEVFLYDSQKEEFNIPY